MESPNEPWIVDRPRSDRRQVALFLVGLCLVLLLCLSLLLLGRSRLRELEDANEQLAAEVCLLDVCCDQGQPIPGCERVAWKSLATDLESRLAVIGRLDTDREQLPAWLEALETALPTGAWLTRLAVTDTRLDLHGRSAGADGAAAAMGGLQESPCFVDVELVQTEADPRGPGQRFQLRAGLTEDCQGIGSSGRDLFRPVPEREENPTPAPHAQIRWDLRDYVVTAVSPGAFAWLRDPDGGTHQVREGSVVGAGGARVTIVTDDSLILTLDELLDEETGEAATRIITLRLEQP